MTLLKGVSILIKLNAGRKRNKRKSFPQKIGKSLSDIDTLLSVFLGNISQKKRKLNITHDTYIFYI